jgi:hypothetical protein
MPTEKPQQPPKESDGPRSLHGMPPEDAIRQMSGAKRQNTTECPKCGAQAAIIYGFADGLQRGRLDCPECDPFDWPPRQC